MTHSVRHLVETTSRYQQTQCTLLDWLWVGYGIEKPSNKLLAATDLDSDTWVAEVKRIRGKQYPLPPAGGPRPKGLELFLHRWDSSTMTLTVDSKGRIACRGLFPPHASFEALKEPDGRVTLIRLRREDRKPRLVKPVVRKGLLVLPMDNAELDSEALDREIREERERENARLLG